MEELFKLFVFEIAPYIASIVIVIAYLPQTIKTQRTKNVEGISMLFWVLINVFLFCMWSNSLGAWIYDGRFGYFLTETLNWSFALWALIQVIVFGKKDKNKKQ